MVVTWRPHSSRICEFASSLVPFCGSLIHIGILIQLSSISQRCNGFSVAFAASSRVHFLSSFFSLFLLWFCNVAKSGLKDADIFVSLDQEPVESVQACHTQRNIVYFQLLLPSLNIGCVLCLCRPVFLSVSTLTTGRLRHEFLERTARRRQRTRT